MSSRLLQIMVFGTWFATSPPMIDPFLKPQTPVRPDRTYLSWQKAGQKTIMRMDSSGRTAGPMPFVGFMDKETAIGAQNLTQAYAPSNLNADGSAKPDIAYDNQGDQSSFDDVIDIINPLQHIPVIGNLYRSFTNDTIKPMSSIIGDTIFGGPIGAVISTINVIVKDRTGKDIAENAMAAVGFDGTPSKPQKPDIVFDVASNRYNSVQRNFAAKATPDMRWNA